MAEFLTTNGCADRLEQLVTNARETLFLVSPYVQTAPIILERLIEASERGVEITLIYGKKDLRAAERVNLARIPRLKLRFLENLHAKCYASESGVLITSLNLYAYSDKTNREMGVLLSVQEPAYETAMREIRSMLVAAVDAPPSEAEASLAVEKGKSHPKMERSSQTRRSSSESNGYCVRCHVDIALNSERPLCHDCFETWNLYANPDYPERWCHECGDEAETTMSRPLCTSCYRAATRVGARTRAL